MQDCKHLNFDAKVAVARLVQEDGQIDAIAFNADIRINCRDCGKPFEFIGLPMGFSSGEPRCSVDAQEARIPIKPVGTPLPLAHLIPSFGVKRVF